MRTTSSKIIICGLVLAQEFVVGASTKKNNRNNKNANKKPTGRNHGYDDYYGYDDGDSTDDYYGYVDYQYQDDHYYEDDRYYEDDHYYNGGKGGKKGGKKGSKKGGKKGSKKRPDNGDDAVIGPGGTTLAVSGAAFSPPALLAIPPIGAPSTTPGTIYPFGNWTNDVNDITAHRIPIHVEGELDYIWLTLDGLCTRTGTPINTVEGYCHFTYTLLDPYAYGNSTIWIGDILGTFIAEGLLTSTFGSLAVTGGSGILTGVTGIVEVATAVLDTSSDPPFVVSEPAGLDLFDDVDGYVHEFELNVIDEFTFTLPYYPSLDELV